MITGMAEAGDVLGAQKAIMAELEIEIGGVSKALGETSLGAIDKFKTAWVNLTEELGEASTNWFANIAPGLQGKLEYITDWLAKSNAYAELQALFDGNMLFENMSAITVASLPLSTLEDALYEAQIKLSNVEGKYKKEEVDSASFGVSDKEQAKLDLLQKEIWYEEDLISAIKRVTEARIAHNQALKDEETLKAKTAGELEAAEWLANLKKQEAFKNSLNGLDEIAVKHATNKFQAEETYRDVLQQAYDAGFVTEEQQLMIQGIINKAHNTYLTGLTKEEKIARALLETKKAEVAETKRLSDIDLYGTKAQQDAEKILAYTIGIKAAMSEQGYSTEYVNAKIKEFTAGLDEVSSSSSSSMGTVAEDVEEVRTEVDILNEALFTLGETISGLGMDLLSGSFDYLGRSIAGVSEGADSWEVAMQKIIASSMSAVGPNLMLAGTQMLVATLGTSVAGWALLGAGATMTGIGGYLAQSATNAGSESTQEIGVSSTATNAVVADFSSDSRSLGSTNIQNNVINNTGASVSTTSTTAPNGRIILETIVDVAVKTTANTYGLQKAGRNVSR